MSAKKGLLAKKIKEEEEKLADATDLEEQTYRQNNIETYTRQIEGLEAVGGGRRPHRQIPTLDFSAFDGEGEGDDTSENTQIEEEVGNVGSALIKPVVKKKPKKQRGNLNIDVASIVKRAFSSKKTLF